MSLSFSNKRVVIDCGLYMIFIFILSSIPYVSEKVFISWEFQNLLHVPLYGVLGFLWMRAFFYNKAEYRAAVVLTLVISLLYAITDEFHQSFVPGRDASVADFLFDAIGAIGGALIYRYNKSIF